MIWFARLTSDADFRKLTVLAGASTAPSHSNRKSVEYRFGSLVQNVSHSNVLIATPYQLITLPLGKSMDPLVRSIGAGDFGSREAGHCGAKCDCLGRSGRGELNRRKVASCPR